MVRSSDDPNVLKMPKSLAITLVVLMCGGVANWARMEMRGEMQAASTARIEAQNGRIEERLSGLERQAWLTRSEAQEMNDSLRSEFLAEIRRTRSVMHARADDMEYRINQLAVPRRRMP